MLRKIKLVNFKCFEQLDLDCTSLNLLCGLNGMGKSSVIQSLLVLQQSFETGELLNGRLVLDGERIDLGTGLDILFEGARGDVVGFALQDDEITDQWGLVCNYSQPLNQWGQWSNNINEHTKYLPEAWQKVPPFGGRLIYVNAERVGPRKLYPLSGMHARRGDFGTSGEYAWNYLNLYRDDRLSDEDPRIEGVGRGLLNVVNQWLQDVCPGARLELESVADADVVIAGFSFDRIGDIRTSRYRATNVGFGLSYVLPVILALLSPPGTLCLIENPEAHLHPRGQTKLAELAARAASVGVQVFAETHSDHFIDGVRIAVRDGLIGPKDTAIHYFERDGNNTVVSSPQVDADGRLSHWPAGFFDQHEENLARLLAPRS
ncbi:MAG: DUF3696 domain-containing protein [Gammaproteobacteria bacterium]|nr:DUF3696 domain-containing protein [Gammaproteobacteria bacterium]MYB58661.1 DUF3696 domain-containing protein [Gemmatimonadota bacterium]